MKNFDLPPHTGGYFSRVVPGLLLEGLRLVYLENTSAAA